MGYVWNALEKSVNTVSEFVNSDTRKIEKVVACIVACLIAKELTEWMYVPVPILGPLIKAQIKPFVSIAYLLILGVCFYHLYGKELTIDVQKLKDTVDGLEEKVQKKIEEQIKQ